jgi:hypothetical protein
LLATGERDILFDGFNVRKAWARSVFERFSCGVLVRGEGEVRSAIVGLLSFVRLTLTTSITSGSESSGRHTEELECIWSCLRMAYMLIACGW